jgi:hypothetical protein
VCQPTRGALTPPSFGRASRTRTKEGIDWSDPVQATFGVPGTDKEALALDLNAGILCMVYDVNRQHVDLVRSEEARAAARLELRSNGLGSW